MIQARFQLDEYTARVLDVVKGKYGLKNRDEALRKIALEVGEKYVDPIIKEDFLRELDEVYESHKKKYSKRKMSDKELRGILNV